MNIYFVANENRTTFLSKESQFGIKGGRTIYRTTPYSVYAVDNIESILTANIVTYNVTQDFLPRNNYIYRYNITNNKLERTDFPEIHVLTREEAEIGDLNHLNEKQICYYKSVFFTIKELNGANILDSFYEHEFEWESCD